MARRCVRKKFVYSSRLRRRVKRCAKWSGGGRRRRGKSISYRSRRRKPAGMARRGSKCVARKFVYSRVLRKRVKRCVKFR